MIKTAKKHSSNMVGSLTNFVMEINQYYKLNKVSFMRLSDNKHFTREKHKYSHQKTTNTNFNVQEKMEHFFDKVKDYQEDKENMIRKNLCNTKNVQCPIKKECHAKIGSNENFSLDKHSPYSPLTFKSREKIEFYDEMFNKSFKIKKFEENDLPFTKSVILPKVKWMKIDNDVKTDDEQLKDAIEMMRDSIKEAIKLIQNEKDYLSKNLSRKMKYSKK